MRIVRQFLSFSDLGEPILVTATVSPGTNVHVVPNGLNVMDVVHLWAWDSAGGGGSPLVAIEWGKTGGAAVLRFLNVEYPLKVIDGLVLGPGKLVAVTASIANQIYVVGYVDRIYQD